VFIEIKQIDPRDGDQQRLFEYALALDAPLGILTDSHERDSRFPVPKTLAEHVSQSVESRVCPGDLAALPRP
jgi:hypothetical protein